MWQHRGKRRPSFAHPTNAGQESIWDYPRPPVLVDETRQVEVTLGGHRIASSQHSKRLLETASAPTFYLPPEDVDTRYLRAGNHRSFCEWKGEAAYWHVEVPDTAIDTITNAAWTYPDPAGQFACIAGWYAFYPHKLSCLVAGEAVRAQPGGFYGGWITSEVIGPFKGAQGTGHW